MTPDYLNQLLAIAHLGLPLTKVPNGVATTIGLQCALLGLEEALLQVQIEVLTEQIRTKGAP